MQTSLSMSANEGWRQTHLGRLLGHAMRRFDQRVLHLMAHDAEVPLALSNLAARGQVGAALFHITRHLAVQGARLQDLASWSTSARPGAWSRAKPTGVMAAPSWCASRPPDWPGCVASRGPWSRPKPNSNRP
jgi:hypothetical protein